MAAGALTVDGGEEAGAQVVVQVLVLAHLKHLLPLLLRHLALDALCGLLFLSYLFATKLEDGCTFRAECRTRRRACTLTVAAVLLISVRLPYSWVGRGHVAGQEGQSVGELSDSQGFQAPHALSLKALLASCHAAAGL